MCGIAGLLVGSAASAPGNPHAILAAMARVLRHRGPDADGHIWNGVCGLASTRLSVIDLSAAGRQPMVSEDGRYTLIFNGEIYNFRELRERFALDARGHRFRSCTDTEVLLHLFEELGSDCLEHLNGMFAFAIWDAREQRLHLVRDPFGIKPLFYMQTGGVLYFASEIKALLQLPNAPLTPSREALHHFLSLNYIPGPLTAFEGIHELLPGHNLEARPDMLEPRAKPYWRPRPGTDESLTEITAAEESQRLFRAALRRQLVADVPVGVMLSGGLDSSAIAAGMAGIRGSGDFHTFSLTFEDPTFDESLYARQVARHLGVQHHEVCVTADRVPDLLPRCLAAIDEPYGDGGAIPTWMLSESARDHVTVLLSGEGGDELHAGYDTHAAFLARALYRHIPAAIRQHLIAPCVDRLPVSLNKLSFEFRAKRFVRGAELDIPQSHFFWRTVLTEDVKAELAPSSVAFSPSVQLFVEAYAESVAREPLGRLMEIDRRYHLPDDLMIKNDRMTMAHGLEARVPFLDHELVNFLTTVPVRHRIGLLQRKRLLRRNLQGMLPATVLRKRKMGLEMPYSRWLLGPLREFARDTLAESRIRTVGFFEPTVVQRLWDEHARGQADHGRALWGLLNYVMWHDLYISGKNYHQWLPPPRPPRNPTVSERSPI